jgi:hypothetical protein
MAQKRRMRLDSKVCLLDKPGNADNTGHMMTEATTTAIGTRYPLLFNYRETLFGNAFLVEVQAINGRALCAKEADDEYWIYGINPGGMAAYGDTPDAAYRAFRNTCSHILIDLAVGSDSFEGYRDAVAKFFEDTNPGYEAEWHEAIARVRRGEVILEGVDIVPANSPRSIVVSMKQVEKVTPQDNSANLQYLLAA